MQENIETGLQENKNENEPDQNVLRLDYSLENPEDRVKLVNKIVENTPP